MTVTVKNIVPRKTMEAAQIGQYTAQGCRTVIDKFTVTNYSGIDAVFSVNLPAQGGVANTSNLVISNRSLVPSETYTCPELVGQVLEAGGFISTVAGAANSLSISASGREIT